MMQMKACISPSEEAHISSCSKAWSRFMDRFWDYIFPWFGAFDSLEFFHKEIAAVKRGPGNG